MKATSQPQRLVDDGTRGWPNWYLLNRGHPPLRTATTRKLKNPKWCDPDGATLRFEVQCHSDNQLVLTFNCNARGAMIPGQPAVDCTMVKKLPDAGFISYDFGTEPLFFGTASGTTAFRVDAAASATSSATTITASTTRINCVVDPIALWVNPEPAGPCPAHRFFANARAENT